MGSLGRHEYEQLLDLVFAILDNQLPGPPWPLVASWLRTSLDAPAAAFGSHGPRPGSVSVSAWTDRATFEVPAGVPAHAHTHPLARVFSTGERSPLRVSDVADRATWRRNPNYELSYRYAERCVYQLGLPLSASHGSVRCFFIGRPGRDFSDRDLEIARHARRLLDRVDAHLTELERLRSAAPATMTASVTEIGITPRELVVLGLIARGLTAAAIGRRLGITTSTVSKHQANLYRELGPAAPAPAPAAARAGRPDRTGRLRRLWSTVGDGSGGAALDRELTGLGTFHRHDVRWNPPADLDASFTDYLTASAEQLKRLVDDGVVRIADDGSISPVEPV